ncbi:acyl-CoA-binding domain-containing protein 3-like isoform X2 [Andrographis paniculata]|uniref:acyl-CoA-binding domain-containing protein 3-like isoform X2 n=1 Tax=Andrographis paniculata TaxID=175694 RepID=UPI0021E75CF1|nr:acyl-CoA-binding domain-containing protein 3-like isoform X2 [Andrographis paniculata]
MEIFQEPTFTALMVIVLSFAVAKIVSFAVCCSGNTVVCCVDEVDDCLSGKGFGKSKKKKRVKFVDDVVVGKVDCFQGFESRVFLGGDGDGVGVESVIKEFEERVDESGVNEVSGGKLDRVAMLVDEHSDGGSNMDEGFIPKEENFMAGDGDGDRESVSFEEKNEVGIEKGRGLMAMVENEGQVDDEEVESRGDLESVILEEKNEVRIEEGRGLTAIVEIEGQVDHKEVENRGVMVDGGGGIDDNNNNDDDDGGWEGIERSELEKAFAEAVNYVEYGVKGTDHLTKSGSDVQMQLYGLHKIAVEGPCHDPPPMALKVSARARWNAWQRLGSMGREAAMEQYISVLSDTIPGWMHSYSANADDHGSLNLDTNYESSAPAPVDSPSISYHG